MLKPNVLRNKKDFTAIYNKGKSIGERYVVLFYKKNNLTSNRTAFLASKKVGNSVLRNRARRLMKESYRELEQNLDSGYDLIWIARNTIVNLKCADVKKSMEAAIKKSGIRKKRADG
jgi:ribonuclease P protein component, eubacterial